MASQRTALRVETPPMSTMMASSARRSQPPSSARATSRSATKDATPSQIIQTLRLRVRGCIARHHIASALFYADKLATLSPSEPSDVLLFAETCFLHREYHRAIHIVKTAGLLDFESPYTIAFVTLEAFLLVGQSMLAIKHKEECLDLLAKVVPEDEISILAFARRYSTHAIQSGSVNIVASLALLMGETFEEAFFHLVEKQMLTAHEQTALLESLDFSVEDSELLHDLYGVHIGKYESVPTPEAKFSCVEESFGLHGNIELNIAKAETFYYQHDLQKAQEICERVRDSDPYNSKVVPVYVAIMVELNKKRDLYQYAHHLVDVYPKKACSWYTVGCYYLLIQKFDAAQRYFHKATTLEPSFAPAWIGFGNAFAAQDESDQAMSSYRTASSLFPGCHLPTLYIGMEHLRTNNLPQALEFIKQASVISPSDPLIYNELGSVYYKQQNYEMAIEMFTKALSLCKHLPERLMETWEPTLFNLGYAYRKLGKYDDAIRYFRSALRLSPRNASIHSALGFTYHMKGDLEDAIECYHSALAYNSEESLAGEMIAIAFEESLSASRAIPHPPAPPSSTPKPASMFKTMPAAATRGAPATAATATTGMMTDDNVRRTLQLDQSFSSNDRSRVYQNDSIVNGSSLEFSDDDDSSMNMDEE